MKLLKILSIVIFLSFSQVGQSAPAQMPADASLKVKAADQIRNPSEDYQMRVLVDDGERPTEFEVYLKGVDKTLIVTKTPVKDKGRNMLMLDRDFNAYIPNLKKSMRLSLSQKLSGQVANGDISRTRWYGDYDVQLEKEDAKESQLLLKAKKENLTYAWIRLWLDKNNNRPLRADYLALNGSTLLKRAFFEDYKELCGAVRPSAIKIEDTDKHISYVRILSMEKKSLDESFFTIRNMESMK